MRLAVAGAAGRMGRTLARVIHEGEGVELVAGFERTGSALLGADFGDLAGIGSIGIIVSDDIQGAIGQFDAIIDFTTPASTIKIANYASSHGFVHVIGTTGLSEQEEAIIDQAAQNTVIIKSGNMSMGVNLLAALVKQAANSLGLDFDIEILEMHHRAKVDAPSGTALLLGEAAAVGRGIELSKHSIRSRDGQTGARPSGDIGFANLRGGSVVGDHTVIFAGNGERLELTHRAENRDIFARGAVKAAKWAFGRKAGRYDMADVLGIK